MQTFDPGNLAHYKMLSISLAVDYEDSSVDVYEESTPRKHLGGSVIGSECARQLWYGFRWVKRETFIGRMLRLFNRGHREEPAMIKVLEASGHTFALRPDGKQNRIPTSANGHFGGSLDEIGKLPPRYGFHEWILYEFKTAKAAKFRKMVKEGVKRAQYRHWVQMCVYGLRMGIQYALYMVVNKDDDTMHFEFLKLDWTVGEEYLERADMIVNADIPPAKFGRSRSVDVCRMCNFVDICHDNGELERNCRSCTHAKPVENGKWLCQLHNGEITDDGVEIGCDDYRPIV